METWIYYTYINITWEDLNGIQYLISPNMFYVIKYVLGETYVTHYLNTSTSITIPTVI